MVVGAEGDIVDDGVAAHGVGGKVETVIVAGIDLLDFINTVFVEDVVIDVIVVEDVVCVTGKALDVDRRCQHCH